MSDRLHISAKKGWQASEWTEKYKDIWARLHQDDADEKIMPDELTGEGDKDYE